MNPVQKILGKGLKFDVKGRNREAAFGVDRDIKPNSGLHGTLNRINMAGSEGATNSSFKGQDLQGVYNDINVLVRKGYVTTTMIKDSNRFGNNVARRVYYVTPAGEQVAESLGPSRW